MLFVLVVAMPQSTVSFLLLPKVRHRIMKEAQAQIDAEMAANSRGSLFLGANSKLKNFLYERPAHDHQPHGSSNSPPIADNYKAGKATTDGPFS